MNGARYSLPAILLHWLMAVIVGWLLWRGWTMIDLAKGAERTAAYSLHKSFGLLVLLLLAIRLAWRRRQPPPPLTVSGWEAKLAHLTHHALYAFLLLAPLAGYLASSFSAYPLKFFGFEVLKAGWPDEGLNGMFKLLHVAAAWGGAGLIVLHVAGAAKHAMQRDGSLRRMLPGRLFRN